MSAVDVDGARADDYAAVGFRGRVGPGDRPALIVVDICRAYLEDGPFSDGDGGRFEAARASADRVVTAARAAGVPIVFTQVVFAPGGADGGWFVVKVPGLSCFEAGSPFIDFPDSPAPTADDVIVVKQYASAFFGTSLASTLRARGIDTAVVLGFSTSGCVRATAVDALQHGFRPLVVREACGERDQRAHDQNLFDLDSKYADVLGEDEIIDYFQGVNPHE